MSTPEIFGRLDLQGLILVGMYPRTVLDIYICL